MNDFSTSDSSAQRRAEAYLVNEFFADRGIKIYESNKHLSVDGASICLDGFNEEEGILLEVYARQGKLKAAQYNKVLVDIAKLFFYERATGKPYKKYFVFACQDAMKSFEGLNGKTWRGSLSRCFEVILELKSLPSELEKEVKDAQRSQNLIKP